jgi:hypothetical protein
METIPLPAMFPDTDDTSIYKNDRGDPALGAVDFRSVLQSDKVIPLLMTEEK